MTVPSCICLIGLAYWGSSKAQRPPHQTAGTDNTAEGSDMRIINLTPHAVTLVTASGDEVVVQPEATPVRLPATTTPAGEVNGIPLVEERLGDADSVLPDPRPGVVYVVARPVAERANRPDLLVPTQVERVNGRPVRARALARVMAASPRTAAADAIIRIAEMVIVAERDYPAGLELLEVAAQIRRGSIPAFRGVRMELATLKRDPAADAQFRREIRAALATLRSVEDAYVADVQKNPPADLPCSECGGTGREVFVPTA